MRREKVFVISIMGSVTDGGASIFFSPLNPAFNRCLGSEARRFSTRVVLKNPLMSTVIPHASESAKWIPLQHVAVACKAYQEPTALNEANS